MSTKKRTLFSIDLRIDKSIIKLKIYDDDTEQKLIYRICQLLQNQQNLGDKLKLKLNQCFRQLLTNGCISDKIRKKIQSLLDKDRRFLKDNDSDNNISSINNETPFHILQESLQCQRLSQQKMKKHYNYLNEQSLFLNYSSEEKNGFCNFGSKEYAHKSTSKKHQMYPVKIQKQTIKNIDQQSDLYRIFKRKYKQIDRKCERFIAKNTANKNINKCSLDLDRNISQRSDIQKVSLFNWQTEKTQTFQNYKMNRMNEHYHLETIGPTILIQLKQDYSCKFDAKYKDLERKQNFKYNYL